MPKLAQPELIERPDGWYVIIQVAGGVGEAGPGTKEQAEAILKHVSNSLAEFDAKYAPLGPFE